MTEQQDAAGGGRAQERCLCCEAMDRVKDALRVPERTREHLRNSRIEFLKAIRSLIDERIDHLSRAGQQGTKVTVE